MTDSERNRAGGARAAASPAAGERGGRTDLRDRLMMRTGPLHAAVERHARMARLLSPDLDRVGLADSLMALHAGIAWLEGELAMSADPVLAGMLPLCDSAARLRSDIVELTGQAPPGGLDGGSGHGPGGAPPPVGPGSLWVLWGAHKGNAVVGAALARGLYRQEAFRSRYFAALPADRRRYEDLMALLRGLPEAQVESRVMPQAQAAFGVLQAMLDRVPPHGTACAQASLPPGS